MLVTLNNSPLRKGWPSHGIPEEIFAYVATHLPRKDIYNLRLVNKEFAFKLQKTLFNTIAVSFRPTIYASDETSNEKIDNFEALGSCVSRFGLSFEVDQLLLFDPPGKSHTEEVKTFWGEYEWAKSDYVRFDSLKRVEEIADQFGRMKRAFKTLTNLSEFALSFDTGYGWLNPPILLGPYLQFEGKRGIFREDIFDTDSLEQSKSSSSTSPVKKHIDSISLENLKGYLWSILPEQVYEDIYLPSDSSIQHLDSIPDYFLQYAALEVDPTIEYGHRYGENRDKGDCQLYPRNPTHAQTEWLLETAWAAQAILGSCICSVIDTKESFLGVHTLNISSISSSLLENFSRRDFFDAFPRLTRIILMVIPDWKQADMAWDPLKPMKYIDPSTASNSLNRLLDKVISRVARVQCLRVGYVGGGEHAKGKHARNQHILPAPITKFPRDAAMGWLPEPPLTFPHIKHLTFENCWFSPHLLVEFFKGCYQTPLESLTFNSCSLTAQPGTRPHPYVSDTLRPSCKREEYYMESLREGTWVDIINQFTPGLTLIDQKALLEKQELNQPRKNLPPFLNRLEFVSCGYVRLAPFFNQNNIVVPYQPLDQAFPVVPMSNPLPQLPPRVDLFQDLAQQNPGLGFPLAQGPPVTAVPVAPGVGGPPSLLPHPSIMRPSYFATNPPATPLYTLIMKQYPGLHGPLDDRPPMSRESETEPESNYAVTLMTVIMHPNPTLAALPPGPIQHAMFAPMLQAISDDNALQPPLAPVQRAPSYIDCRLLATVVQCIGKDEEQILECGFGMTFGWRDVAKRIEVRDDFFKQGGAGRFTGVILASDRGFYERRFSSKSFEPYWESLGLGDNGGHEEGHGGNDG
ncbi:hypothetical protein GX48_00507 [Paracoccidioides brasiliensis]|nr:hypothetical protein GX48_00507 [Paracoccidioides brasiliensis]